MTVAPTAPLNPALPILTELVIRCGRAIQRAHANNGVIAEDDALAIRTSLSDFDAACGFVGLRAELDLAYAQGHSLRESLNECRQQRDALAARIATTTTHEVRGA